MSARRSDQVIAALVVEVRRAVDARPASRAEVAKRAGIPPSTFARKINGTSPWYVEELARLGNVLGLTLGDLVKRAQIRAWTVRTLGDDADPQHVGRMVDFLAAWEVATDA